MSILTTVVKTPIVDKGLDEKTIKKLPGPPEFTEELRMRQETDGVLLESYLIYEPEHEATWFKDNQPLLGALDFDEKYQPFLERRGDWTYCALAIRHLSNEDAGNFMVNVRNQYGDKSNHVRLSMKDPNEPAKGGIEPTFFRKPISRQEGPRLLHLECEVEALPPPSIHWFLGDQEILQSDKYSLFRAVQPSNQNIHFVRLTITDPSPEDGGNYIVKAVNEIGEKDCTLALNFGNPNEHGDNIPARVYEQPLLHQPDPATIILEAHVIANPKPKIQWLCNGDFVKEGEKKFSKLLQMDDKNKWTATLTIMQPSKSDGGEYKCSVKNKWGNDHTTFALG